jgi:hypothetical protein
MKRLLLTLLASMALLTTTAEAAIIHFEVELFGTSENPPNSSPATGSATIELDTITRFLTIDVTFSGLLGTTTASHIHCCAATPLANAPVATQTPTFQGFPLGVTSGSYLHTFDMTMASSYNPSFITAHGATVDSAYADLLAGMLGGQAYLNIHTTQFAGGEIRGTLSQVPEPATLALLGLAFVGLGTLRRRSSP